ncbi:MAG: AAA family ATPase [Deltaproteobacteria bacterium]|nr:AAA family ATPase [Deltaproteobacteria bacterium]
MQIDHLDNGQLREVKTACSHLFPGLMAGDREFLDHLDPGVLKNAYRRKVKAYHPDLHPFRSKESLIPRFLQVRDSYKLLSSYLEKETRLSPKKGDTAKKIIAIGGAKGGTGKSVFAANLGVFLSSRGFKTVVVDLDLGGANLHLYLGEKALLKRSINDFLEKKFHTLSEVMIESRYGPLIIGGDSSVLGAANLPFYRKLKLLRAVSKIDADYVIIDLGGGISFNTLDFFLAADYGIVITTRESASYIGAYHFIKAALYRKLNRLFGPESRYGARKDEALERHIREFTMPANESDIKTIKDFVEHTRTRIPSGLPLIERAISDFHPYLIVNRVPHGFDANQIVTKVQSVSKTWLSKGVESLGNISFQTDVEKSVIDLVPVVSRYPGGELAMEIGHMAGCLLNS